MIMHKNENTEATHEMENLLKQGDENPKEKEQRAKVALFILVVCAIVSSLGNVVIRNTSEKSNKSKQAITGGLVGSNKVKEQQIQNYINGTALMVNIHITHHAGTFFCDKMRLIGPTPAFACLGGDNWPSNETKYQPNQPWKFNDTACMVPLMRSHFHMISWEFSKWANLHNTTNWEYPDLLSVIVMRDPIDRLMAGGKCGNHHNLLDPYIYPSNDTQQDWWEYVNADCADNLALKVLAPDAGCCDGANTSVHYVDDAKNLLRRFTFILDQACLNESLIALGQKLNISVDLSQDIRHLKQHRIHMTARERLANDTLYEFVRRKFRRDIELYEWAKSQSIVDCSKLDDPK
jgi:hypothetical protein